MKLFDAIDGFLEAREWMDEHALELEAAGGAVPDELVDAFDAAFEADEILESKVEKTIAAERELRTLAERAKAEADRLGALAKSYDREADAVKTFLGIALRRGNLKRLDTAVGKASHYFNTRPSIDLFSEKIPTAFERVKEVRDLDGAKVYEALKAANLLPPKEEVGGVPVPSSVVLEAGTEFEYEGETITLDAPLIARLGTHFRIW